VNRKNGDPLLPQDHFTRNQFGYSIGGPVIKDKLFFFSNTEWTRIRSSGLQQAVVVTPSFLASSSAATQNFFNSFGKLKSNAILGQLITPNGWTGPAPLQQVSYAVPSDAGAGNPENGYQTFNRLDWVVSDKTSISGHYALFSDNIFPGTNANSPYAGYDTGSTDYNQNVLINVNHIFGPTFVSSTKLAFNRLNNLQPLGTAPVGPTLYLNQANVASRDASGLPIALPGYLPFSPGNSIPFGGPQNLYQVSEDLTWTRGSHNLQFGGSFIQTRDNRVFGAYENAVEQIAKSGTPEADALLALQAGNVYQFQGAIYPQGKFPCVGGVATPQCTVTLPVSAPSFVRNNAYNDGNWYLQDTWKATQRLTVSLGLRWEYYGVQHNSNPNLESNFFLGSGSNFFQQVQNGSVLTTPNSPVGGLYKQHFKNYAPRVGVAWDPFGDGKTSVRAGYGMGYERNFNNVLYNVIQNPPNYAVISVISGKDVPAFSVTTSNAGPLAGTGSKALPPVSLRALDQNMPTAYSSFYNASVERQVIGDTLVSIEYSGSRGIHQYSIANYNGLGYGTAYLGNSTFSRFNPQYSNINSRAANGDSYYNAMNVRLESNRFQKDGLQLTANYTWAHAIDNLSSTFSQSGNNFNLGYLNPFNPGLDRGNADYDVRHRIVIAGVWEPKWLRFSNSSPWVKTYLGGWQFAPIFTARTGTPFTIYDCTNALTACPRIVNAPGLKFSGTPVANGGVDSYDYITLPAASANPYVNTNPILSNALSFSPSDLPTCTASGCTQNAGLGRNSWRSPGNYTFDLGVHKNFKFGERYTVQLRGEFYNILNHHNFYVVPGNADIAEVSAIQAIKGSPGGSPSATDERRNIQLALRLDF
jgi:hypothetical protein